MLDELEERRWAETLVALASVEKGLLVDGDAVKNWLRAWGAPEEHDAFIRLNL